MSEKEKQRRRKKLPKLMLRTDYGTLLVRHYYKWYQGLMVLGKTGSSMQLINERCEMK